MSHWTDIEDYVFETGMPDWDMDHRAFLDCLCDLNPLFEENDLILADQPAAADVSSILQRARDLAHRHFQDQEATLNQAELREGQLHVDEHTYFLDVVDRALTDFKVGRMAMTPALRNRLALWWINHINDTDASSLEELVELSAVTPNKAKRQLLTVTVPTEAEPVAVIQKKIRMTLTWDQ
ncbi:MAG: hemerythrin domain-containing protein, partial [Rhodospirillales bacterium]